MGVVSWAPQFQNGDDALIPYLADYDGMGHYLHPVACAKLQQMSADYQATFGNAITISEAFRNIDTQWYYWNLYQSGQGNVAAYPGNSTHGEALAVDINSWVYGSSTGTPQHAWLRTTAENYGWDWYLVGQPSGESWHFNYIGDLSETAGGDVTPFDPEEAEIMGAAQDILDAIERARVDAVGRQDNTIIPTLNSVSQAVGQISGYADAVKAAVRKEGRGRLYFDSGLTGAEYTEATSPREMVAKVTDGFIYALNGDPVARQGQINSLRTTHYLLIDAAEVAEGLPTAQFNNVIEMANGHLRRIAAEVVRQMAPGAETAETTYTVVPNGVDPTPVLAEVPTAK